MKTLAISALVLLLGFTCWTERSTLSQLKDRLVTKASHGEPVESSPSSSSDQFTSPATASSHSSESPGDTYYLREVVNFSSTVGVRKIDAGTLVRKIGEDTNGLVTVDDGLGQFPVESPKLSRSPIVASVLQANLPSPRSSAK